VLALAACDNGESATMARTGDAGTDGNDTGFFGPPTDPTFTGTTAPPEQEQELLLSPAQTDVYVFVANPDRNTVSRVNVVTLEVATTETGADPRLVLTTSDFTKAVVLNRGDDSLTIVDADTLAASTIPVREGFNDMVLSPDGTVAVAWHDTADEREDDPPDDGLQSFNEVSFVDLVTLEHFPMAVGFDPHDVVFTPDSRLAAVVADAYVAVVDLTVRPLVPRLVELTPGVVDPPQAEELILSPDGSFAWVRQFGATELLVVDLDQGVITTVAAGGNPTDLDLSPDGAFAVAVARDAEELWVYDADSPGAAPQITPLPPSGYGSLTFAPDGETGIVYTTAVPLEQLGVWDLATDTVVERAVVKPISSVAVDPTGQTVLVFHTLEDGERTEPLFAGSYALTLIALSDFRSNPLLLPSEPLGFAHSLSGGKGYFAMHDEPYLEVLDYQTLLHDQITLGSLPSFVGVLPDLTPVDGDEPPAWVSQEHPLGRISFYDADGPSLETLTGFELNSGVEEE
jgi:DNA-binding beta-propeller fold protein YncE